MLFIKGLYTTLTIVTVVNVIVSLYCFWPRVNQPTSANDDAIWTWKDTIWLILMIISIISLVVTILFLFSFYMIKWLMIIIMISYFLGQIARVIPSAETVGNIVRGKTSKALGANDYASIITLAFFISYLNIYGISDKVIEYAVRQTNTILSDWLLLGFYVASIAITTFFICSLVLKPFKIVIELLRRIFSRFSNRKEPLLFNKLKKQVHGTVSTKTWTTSLIENSIKQHSAFGRLLWLGTPITIILDVLREIALLIYDFVASIILYLIYIALSSGNIFLKIGKWILSLSDRNVVAISFRIATILGFGCTVIINQYEPFLQNQESTSVFEFVSSTIIIPVVLEWILSNKSDTKNIN